MTNNLLPRRKGNSTSNTYEIEFGFSLQSEYYCEITATKAAVIGSISNIETIVFPKIMHKWHKKTMLPPIHRHYVPPFLFFTISPYKNFSILFVFYTYLNPILILPRSILLLFSLIRKIDHLFYSCFASNETLFYKQWSILSLFYYTKPQNSP